MSSGVSPLGRQKSTYAACRSTRVIGAFLLVLLIHRLLLLVLVHRLVPPHRRLLPLTHAGALVVLVAEPVEPPQLLEAVEGDPPRRPSGRHTGRRAPPAGTARSGGAPP